ncbi:MAG: carbamoyl phosphate synthase-like protein [Planctomycetes bacterium ADurb.Bin412]|nr:MAG: carbamoyl phosphate synthase-like protein [Planctomycetes bacterium ADurb.Bin412]
MSKKFTILFPCVGRRVSLVRAFQQSCKRLGYQPRLIGSDKTEYSSALQCCNKKYVVTPVFQNGYAQEMMNIVRKERVDLLVPTVDLDLPVWAERREELADTGCTALISTPEVVQICQDKRQMFRFLREHGFRTPETYSVEEILKRKKHTFPYFLKPWDGHASRGNAVARDLEELKFYTRRIPNCMVQDFVDGQEYTVDVFVDFAGAVRCAVPRRRIETRAGEVSKGVTVKNPSLMQRCKELMEALGAGPGVITIQCFLTVKNQIEFIEINPRFGGGAPLSIQAGADFPYWILQFLTGHKPRISFDKWRDKLVMLRYDGAIWYQK